MLYEIFTVGKIRSETTSLNVIFSQRFRIPNESMNLLSRIQRKEDSAFTRPFTVTALESLLQITKKCRRTKSLIP